MFHLRLFDIAFSQSSCVIDVPFRIIYGLSVFMHPTFGSHLQTSNHGTPLKSAAAPKRILIVLCIKYRRDLWLERLRRSKSLRLSIERLLIVVKGFLFLECPLITALRGRNQSPFLFTSILPIIDSKLTRVYIF